MAAAIDAARDAFDNTDWPTNHVRRQRCLIQLQDALEQEREGLREELIREVGCPRSLTHGPQLDAPLADALRFPASLIDTYPWESSLGDAVISVTGVDTTHGNDFEPPSPDTTHHPPDRPEEPTGPGKPAPSDTGRPLMPAIDNQAPTVNQPRIHRTWPGRTKNRG